MTVNYFKLNKYELAIKIQNDLIARDSLINEAQTDLYIYEFTRGNMAKAMIHRRWMEKTVPWKLRQADSLAFVSAAQNRAAQPATGD